MAFKAPPTQSSVPESPDRLFLDLPRRKLASLYDHQGQILRTYAKEAIEAADVALQLPTGSGKTLVGLLLAEWRRRKFGDKVVYLCPTRQLVNQVAEEAATKYGLNVQAFTGPAREYSPAAKSSYSDAERVAVTTYNSLFNTNPFFRSPNVVIVDDAHAAESYIASQWTLQIKRLEARDQLLFAAVTSVLKPLLSTANYTRMTGDWQGIEDITWVDKISTDRLSDIADELQSVLDEQIGDGEQQYPWRMLSDHLKACQVYVSSSEILIRPLIPPTWTHTAFANAKQRIFMSATLGLGGDLERLTGRKRIKRLAIPEGWDRQGIGRRFFIFPEKSLDANEALDLRHRMMKRAGRSVVLSPSNESATAVQEDVGKHIRFPTFSAGDLEETKSKFLYCENAVAVIANRYDGIDFPDDACRLLFVEGLPRAANLQERFLMARMGAQLLFNERVQTRVLQAVGRCTRSLNDYSAVVVTGQELPEYLTDASRRDHLHPELQAELKFGIEQSSGVDAGTLEENFDIFLKHGEDWEAANEQILEYRSSSIQLEYPAMDQLSSAAPHEIDYQAAMWQGDYAVAYDAAREVLGHLADSGLRGYRALWHYLAGAAADLAVADGDSSLAGAGRIQYQRAKESAAGIPWLVALARTKGIAPSQQDEQDATTMLQVERLESYFSRLGTIHNRDFTRREREIREGLSDAPKFEHAQVLLGEHLGFSADKRKGDASPDPWWIVGDVCIVFEDHAGAEENASIDATKARQAASHPDWLKAHVPAANDARILPVLVSPAKRAKEGAMPVLARVAYWELQDFRVWAERSLAAVRDLRGSFREPGDLAWRASAAKSLIENEIAGPTLMMKLEENIANKRLTLVV